MQTEDIDLEAKDQFIICEKRFYAAMWFVRLPQQDNDNLRLGGDVNALLWAKDESPNHWIFQYRFRYYRTRDVWQSTDKKVWYWVEIEGDRSNVESGVAAMLALLSEKSGFPLEKLEINGTNEEFFKQVRLQSPSWMHHGISDQQAGKGGNPETN